MPTDCISYQNSGYFTPMMNDYLNQESSIQSFYNRFTLVLQCKNRVKSETAIHFTANFTVIHSEM